LYAVLSVPCTPTKYYQKRRKKYTGGINQTRENQKNKIRNVIPISKDTFVMKGRIKFHQTKSWLDMPKLANLSRQVLENFCQIIMKYERSKAISNWCFYYIFWDTSHLWIQYNVNQISYFSSSVFCKNTNYKLSQNYFSVVILFCWLEVKQAVGEHRTNMLSDSLFSIDLHRFHPVIKSMLRLKESIVLMLLQSKFNMTEPVTTS
jgi:hypothetical protein